MSKTVLLSRRGLLGGFGALLAAPAIVRVSSLMPVKVFALADDDFVDQWLAAEALEKQIDEIQERVRAHIRSAPALFEKWDDCANALRNYHGLVLKV